MLQELLQKLERELECAVGGGATLALNAEKVCTDGCYLNGLECLTQTTNQRVCLRKDAMGVLNAVSRLINALAPINRLPPEILGMIPKYGGGQTSKDLVAVSSVCSYWRNTFVAAPSLWTTLDGKGLEKSRAWVKRSGALPIQLLVPGSPDPEVLEFLVLYSHRLKVMHLPRLEARDRSLFTDNHIPNLLRPAPLLRHISVELHGLRAPNFGTPVSMAGEFPSLETLHIYGLSMSITDLRIPNLRNLRLNGALKSLLDLLELSPLLECFTFELNPLQDEPVTTRRKVSLEHVKRAVFLCEGFKVLQHLLLPTSNAITIEIPSHHIDNITNDYAQLLSVLDGLQISRQVLSMDFYLEYPSMARSTSLEGPNGTLHLLTDDIDDPITFTTLLRLLAQRSTKSIRKLRIPALFPIHFDLVGDFLKSLESLCSISMDQSIAAQCLLALGTSHCLQLKEIQIWASSPLLPDCGRLKDFFQERSEAGIPIQRLSIVGDPDVSFDLEVIETLGKYVEVHEVRAGCSP